MADILYSDTALQPTSSAAIALVPAPGFAGIVSLVPQPNGFLLATWGVATSSIAPIFYDIYIQAGSAVGLFNSSNLLRSLAGLSAYVLQTSDGALLVSGTTYFVGIRARDPQGNMSASTASASAISSGVSVGSPLTTADIQSIINGVWNESRSSHVAVGSFGEVVDARISTRASQSTVALIDSKLGTPFLDISADIAATKSDTVAIKIRTDQISFTSGNVNAIANVVGDKTGYVLSGAANSLIANLVWDIARGSHVTAGTFGEALQGIITTLRASYLDNLINLDVATSSLATAASVSGIQNNTNFVGIVPPVLVLPILGQPPKDYLITAQVFKSDGSPVDTDDGKLQLEIVDQAGTPVVSQFNMDGAGVGRWEYHYIVNDTDVEQILYFRFAYLLGGINFNQIRIGETQEWETKVDTLISLTNDLLARLTAGRALNLDNLDSQVSLMQTLAQSALDLSAIQASIATRASGLAVASLPSAAQTSNAVWLENINAIAAGQNAARQLRDAKIFSQIDL